MRKLILIPVMLAMVALSGCESLQDSGTKQTVGTATGALLGGILGSQVGAGEGQLWATGAGALVGALLGSEIGKSLDKADLAYANRANVEARDAPIGETVSWSNPESGHYGTVTPVRDGTSSYGRYCREYQQTIYVDGQQQTAYGTACKNDDGTWQIVN
ncbi:MAG: glycine zipper 2TM domain-containing protein [Alphaproteobacteria bacterium]|nr:glycine zipper 2TM domain-containing protein [Alphaproteobacteria bacterium]